MGKVTGSFPTATNTSIGKFSKDLRDKNESLRHLLVVRSSKDSPASSSEFQAGIKATGGSMKVLRKIFYVIVASILLAGVGSAAYVAFRLISSLLGRMSSEVSAITTIASLVFLVASVIVAGSIRGASGRRKEGQPHADSAATYNVVINVWQEMILSGGTDPVTGAAAEELRALDRLLVLYGGRETIKAHASLRALERDGGPQDPKVGLQFATMLMGMRKELGAKNLGLTAGDLLQLFFADSDDTIGTTRKVGYRAFQPRVTLVSNS
jgi:hypothetical protein